MEKEYKDTSHSEHGSSNSGHRESHSNSSGHSHHSYHESRSRYHSSGHSSSGHSYHSSGYHHHHYHEDKSSEMERNGDNIIYRNVRKGKVFAMLKRALFCIVIAALLIFTITSIINSEPGESFSFFGGHTSKTEEIEDLKLKISQYEQRIEELEAELEQYKAGENALPADSDGTAAE